MDGRSMEARIARLERECRRWRLAGVVAVLGVVGVGAAQKPPDVIRARRLEVVDDKGRPRVTIEASPELCGLSVDDPGGQARLAIGTYDDDSPRLALWPAKGHDAALSLGVPDGGPILSLVGPNGHRMTAGVGRLGPALQMKGAKGEVLFRAPAPGK